MSKIIGLAGKAGSGKDFCYDLIDRTVGAQRLAFADEVRYEVEAERSDLDVWTKPYTEEVRALLQWWGTEYRRAQDPDYWVKKTVERIQASDAETVVLTDVRYANEAKAVRDMGGLVILVHADDAVRKRRLGGQLPPAHASEVIDFKVDGAILNNITPNFPMALNAYLGLPPCFIPKTHDCDGFRCTVCAYGWET